MITRRWYNEMAIRIDACKRCEKTGNDEWANKHYDAAQGLLDNLTHGSGLDGEWGIDWEKSTGEKIVLTMSYHAMNDNGMYDCWINFTVTITASLMFGASMRIKGNFGKHSDVREYLFDILGEDIEQTITL